jgi:hypothetical protein
VLFVDAGVVTNSIAERLASGATSDGYDLGGLFAFNDYLSDVGFGLRLYYDAFGVRNTLLRFDAATPTTPDAEFEPFYYVSLSQAF